MKKNLLSCLLLSAISFSFGQSDEPCGAPTLTTGASCSFTAGNLPSTTTSSTGVPAPGCAAYTGQDVWFQVTVPPSGTLTIDLNTAGGPTDMGMAWYTGSCTNLTLSQCDDDNSANGLMPMIAQTGLTPGSTIFVRIWEYGGNATGPFSICAYAPAPPTPCLGGSNNSCANADPFCTGAPVTYCNTTGIPSMGQYSCLFSTPNPMWMYMEIATSGPLDYTIAQTNNNGNPIDVDFALYGPYTSISNACASIGPGTPTVDCSYSGSATEYANISNAQAGQIYMMLVTNFNGGSGNLVMNQTGGTGSTNCTLISPCSLSTIAVSDTCSSGLGSVSATVVQGTAPYTFDWTTLGNQSTSTVNGVTAGTHSITVTMDDGCVATATIVVPDYTPTATSTSTLVSCAGGADGTATATMTPELGTVSYTWNDVNNQTTQTATGLTAGSYTCTMTSSAGCTVTTTVNVTEIPGVTAAIINQQNVTCNSGNDGILEMQASSGTAPYSYSWDNSSSTSNLANDLSAGAHTLTVTDALGCTTIVTGTLTEPAPLTITSVTPSTMICPEDSIALSVTGSGGSSAYTYSWTQNSTPNGFGQNITVDPLTDNTQYCVTLSEACGSPTADTCIVISFPVPIIPDLEPDVLKDCIPGTFTFTNTSSNSAEIQTTTYTFSDGNSYSINGQDSVSNTFFDPSYYSVQMTIESIYGCIYSGSIQDIVEVVPNPVAAFGFSANPITIFETSVIAQDQSTGGVVDWVWFSPSSEPSTSNTQNTTLNFPIGIEGQYPVTLTVYSEYGCADSVTHELNVVPDVLMFAPNTFTPNNDEYNQHWKYYFTGIDIYDFELMIFNRWGETIWESRDPSVFWDGTYNGQVVPSGTYTWRAWTRDVVNDKKREFFGSINVIR